MPDPIIPTPVATAPEAVPVAPIAPEPAPAVEAAPAAIEAPVVAAAEPVVPAVPDAPAPKPDAALHTDTPTLLESAGDKPAEKADPAKAADAPGDGKPDPTIVAAPIAYEAFKFPETIKAEPEAVTALTELFGSHKIPQEAAQKIIDIGTAAMTRFAENLVVEQHRTFADTRKGWRTEVLADPELGGSGHQTAMAAVARMRDLLVPPERRGAFDNFLRITGAGDHPEFLRILHGAARFFDEPAMPPADARPTGDNGAKPRTGRLRDMYDHSRSANRA